MSPIQSGDVLVIPSSSGSDKFVKGTIEWSQDYGHTYTRDYYMGLAAVKGKDQKVLCFIEAERYQSAGGYDVTIDGSWQYGQKNKDGAGRFAVLHNKSYKPFQHRFTTAAVTNMTVVINNNAKEVGTALGYGNEVERAQQLKAVVDQFAKIFGDYMHNF
ncbi:hypothetical protein RSOLAG22IIIB_13892 [Rhizoctonia solani]|uniref:Uncharacterized protein n=1 Tax=Rhizoctonia solani TaxID=456999 RepID=A0A0K6FRZ9_9AGAM|nr:unnamed protein product [Rhizoctonia solani]CUA68978.1 hypothetical protein RSOLAG22IIIB_13892 [Rhizoctonia solani]